MPHKVKKILVVRVGRAGDVVMITPALKAILQAYPAADIHVITSPDGKRVLKGFDQRLSRLFLYDRKSLLGFWHRRNIRKQVLQQGYNLVFCFEVKPSYHRFYQGLNTGRFELQEANKQLHYSELCLELVRRAAGDKIPHQWAWLPVSDAAREKADKMLSAGGVGKDAYVIGMHPSFSGLRKGRFRSTRQHYLREWPPEYFAELAGLLAAYIRENNINARIIMDLLPDEKDLGEKIVTQSGAACVLFTPPPDFERYKATIARMDLLVTPNTGPMHIAAAVGTNIVALFSGLNAKDCGPFMPPEKYAVLESEKFADADVGIKAIEPGDVFQACKRFLPGK